MAKTRQYAPFIAGAGIALLVGGVAANLVLKDGTEQVSAGLVSVSTSTPGTASEPKTSAASAEAENASVKPVTSVLGSDEVVAGVALAEYQPLAEPFPIPVKDCDPRGTYQEVANCHLADAVKVDGQINRLQEIHYLAVTSDAERQELRTENQAWLDEREVRVDKIGLNSDLPEDEAIVKSAALFLKISEERLAALQPG
ncbi:hypothetical protein [Kineosporia babensis]|uniref:Uncharacterized protein n=1 Tax=Kineosporia babensis TaxID=499548 RepID=A0A9X1N8Y9_9ACTN|nr:hypothetical protein [Kineosporia babensis]MCD5309349.1 hypothetical protein [Kineosporia babensis]